jgi:hypothetical protein
MTVERVMGIEPTLAAWEAAVLPLNYTRDRFDSRGEVLSAAMSLHWRAGYFASVPYRLYALITLISTPTRINRKRVLICRVM